MRTPFWNFVIEIDSGCFLWVGGLNNYGYGIYNIVLNNGDNYAALAHRLAYEYFYLEKPKALITHLCNVRRCVNPLHLKDTSQHENMQYASESGSCGKLKPVTVRAIRKLHDEGWDQCIIAYKFDIGTSQINRIVHRRTWKWVT